MGRNLRLTLAATVAMAAAASCAAPSPPAEFAAREAVTVLLVGDLMLGRSVGDVADADPIGLFADVRRVVGLADIAAVNFESPLTERPHAVANPNRLEADPALARLVAAAGFDVAAIANNHAGDAGPASVTDTVTAIEGVGMAVVGGGDSEVEAWRPLVIDRGGLSVAFLAVDHSRQGLTAGAGPGIASWDEDRMRGAVAEARAAADIVIVSIHGGVEGWEGADPRLMPPARQLAAWGVDVVWGHGSHTGQPVVIDDADGDGRPTIIATSLGNFLFDQTAGAKGTGLVVEVMVDDAGVVAHRVGDQGHDDLRVHFTGWRPPTGGHALVAGGTWELDRPIRLVDRSVVLGDFAEGTVVAASAGDLDRDGSPEVLVSYRHPRRDLSHDPLPPPPTDAAGRSAHIGVIEMSGEPVWMSRRPPHPVGALAACDGTAAFAYTGLDDPEVVAAQTGVWSGFGFVLGPEVAGERPVGCADVDGDGLLDAVVLGEGASTEGAGVSDRSGG